MKSIVLQLSKPFMNNYRSQFIDFEKDYTVHSLKTIVCHSFRVVCVCFCVFLFKSLCLLELQLTCFYSPIAHPSSL